MKTITMYTDRVFRLPRKLKKALGKRWQMCDWYRNRRQQQAQFKYDAALFMDEIKNLPIHRNNEKHSN
nr:hypothetical protein [Mucilaginibacter sp. L294]